MTADPGELQQPGSGEKTAALLVSPVCEQNVIDGFPAAGEAVQCGPIVPVTVLTTSPGEGNQRPFWLNYT